MPGTTLVSPIYRLLSQQLGTNVLRMFLLAMVMGLSQTGLSQTFVHPGGLHTQADLDRMKTQVAAGAHPWIDDWNKLITDPQAQSTYGTHVQANMGASRQNADLDAHAAYLNAIRWYISGDVTYANKAVSILNAWSAAVNQVPTGTDIPGLIGIPIMNFALAGEIMRTYSGWTPSDFARFQSMMTTYLYPVCHDFLTNHNGAGLTNYWANWDACNIGALIAMGVLCDDSAIFNEGVTYFQSGAGTGSIMNAVYYLHTPTLGQWQESGRDQEHAQLGIGLLGAACQVAWNQGVDLFGYSNNRLLAGAEYVAQTNLSKPVPYTYYTNSSAANQSWVSINGLGRLDDRPLWELIYNHYVVLQGLSAPNSQAMAQLMRPEHGSSDHLGYGTLTFTLSGTASPYPPLPIPSVPTGLTATASVSQVALNWAASPTNAAQGYNVLRSTASGGPYTSIASWTANTNPQYVDSTVSNGTTYYYVVAAINQSGTSANSTQASATPLAAGSLPIGWTNQDIGTVTASGSASYSSLGNGTFVATGQGGGIGGTSDTGYNYTYIMATGNFTLTARLWNVNWNSGDGVVGLMMRETLNANSAVIQMTLGDTGLRQAKAATRLSTGANLNRYGGNDYTWIPAWFRLQRSGNTFTAYESSDGVTWFVVRTATISMATTFYAGLVTCTSNFATATFDHVNFSVPAAPTGLSAISTSGSQITLSWTASDIANSYNIKRSGSSGGPYSTIATNVTATNYLDSGLSIGTPYYYVVSGSNAVGEGVDSTEASATPLGTPTDFFTQLFASGANTTGSTSFTFTPAVNANGYTVYKTAANAFSTDPTGGTSLTEGDDTYATVTLSGTARAVLFGSRYATFYVGSNGYITFNSGDTTYTVSTAKHFTQPRISALFDDLNVTGSASVSWKQISDRVAVTWQNVPEYNKSNSNNFQVEMFFDGRIRITLLGISATKTSLIGLSHSTGTPSGFVQSNFSAYPPPPPSITSSLSKTGTNGSAFGYSITASNSPTSYSTSSLPTGLSVNTSSGLISGTPTVTGTYGATISAINASGTGSAALTIIVLPPAPAAPTGLTATNGNGQVPLSWNVASGATSYTVRRTTTSGSNYASLVTQSGTSYADNTVINGTTYQYAVAAANVSGTSAYSNEAGATPSLSFSTAELNSARLRLSGTASSSTMTVPSSVPGHTYTLQYCGDLTTGSWASVGSPLAGTGVDIEFPPIVSSGVKGFYRVLIDR